MANESVYIFKKAKIREQFIFLDRNSHQSQLHNKLVNLHYWVQEGSTWRSMLKSNIQEQDYVYYILKMSEPTRHHIADFIDQNPNNTCDPRNQ